MLPASTVQRPTLGPFEPGVLYPLPDLMARAGLGAAAFRQMRREGLKIRYTAGRGYVLGKWFIDHIELKGRDAK